MAIKTGIGVGDAQVYDISSLENNYFKLLQRQSQEAYKFQEELVDLISKVKTDGARDIDKPLIAKAYDDVKDLYRQATSLKNPTERNLVRAQITSGIQSLNEAAARSAAESKLYTDTLGRVATTGEYMFDANKLNEFKSRINKPITQLSAYNPLDLQRIPDDSVRDRAYDNLYNELKPKAVYQVRKAAGNREQEVGVINPTFVANSIMERLDKSPEWLNLATRNYMQQNPDSKPEFKDIALNEIKLYMSRKGNEYAGAPTRISTGGAGGQQQQAVYDRGKLLDKLVNAVPGSDKELLEVSSLPYGTDTQFLNVTKGGKLVKQLFKITVPKSGLETASASNPILAEYSFGVDDAKNKTKVFEFDLSSPDARRGLNVFIDQFSGGKNVQYRDVKRNNPTPSPKPGASNIPSATRKEWIAAGWNNSQIDEAVKLGKIKVK
jgi:hypothetical protein